MNKQPPSLWTLSLTETFERYGFYTVQSLLTLYLAIHLGLKDTDAYLLVGAFTAMTYISPVVGGWIADHLLGQTKCVYLGAIILFVGYLGLATDHHINKIIYALTTVALGTGLLKPNISSLIGRLYEPGDSRRNSGFTIFYMGINVGILLGTTVANQIQVVLGWTTCFISAAIGLFAAFCIFASGNQLHRLSDYSTPHKRSPTTTYIYTLIILGCFFSLMYWVLQNNQLTAPFFGIIVLATFIYIIGTALREKNIQKKQTFTFLFLFIISILFWALYFQMFLALTLFILRTVRPVFLGISFPPPYYVAIQSIGILVFGTILQKYWAKKPFPPPIAYSATLKFCVAIFLMLLAYVCILFVISSSKPTALLSPVGIIVAYLLISLAELFLSPIGLAAVTDLIRPQVVSTMMGIFFVSLGFGGYLSGKLAGFAAIDTQVKGSLLTTKLYYLMAFTTLTKILVLALCLSLGILLLVRYMFRSERSRITKQGLVKEK